MTDNQTEQTRAAVTSYIEGLDQRDWETVRRLLHDDVIYEIPQTRERIRGGDRYLRFNQEFPGDWHLRIRRVVADGANAAAWLDTRMGDAPQDACVWFEVDEQGRLTRVVDYWPDPYEPPVGREHLVERYEEPIKP